MPVSELQQIERANHCSDVRGIDAETKEARR